MSEANNYNLYDVIFKRKSVRRFDMTPLSDQVLVDIEKQIEGLVPMFPDCDIESRLITSELVKTGLQRAAPHYVAIFADKSDENLLSIGFMFQKLSLYMSTRGIGSCWQGIPSPKKDLLNSSKRDFVIFLAFGNAKEPLYRESKDKFSRKSMKEITDTTGLEELLEVVRLAPSAVNNQPWYFRGDENRLDVYCHQAGIIRGHIMKKYNMMDIGIGLAHLSLAAERNNIDLSFVKDESSSHEAPVGYYYVISLDLIKK